MKQWRNEAPELGRNTIFLDDPSLTPIFPELLAPKPVLQASICTNLMELRTTILNGDPLGRTTIPRDLHSNTVLGNPISRICAGDDHVVGPISGGVFDVAKSRDCSVSVGVLAAADLGVVVVRSGEREGNQKSNQKGFHRFVGVVGNRLVWFDV